MGFNIPRRVISRAILDPTLLKIFGKTWYRRTFSLPSDYDRPDGYSSPMRIISLRITNRCNLRCAMCGQWGESGYYKEDEKVLTSQEVSLEQYKATIDDVKQWKPHYYIWGGEPTMYKDLIPVMRYIKEAGSTMTLTTNGYRFKEIAEEVMEIEPEGVNFSIDGPPQIHNKIRGWDQAYDRMQGSISALIELRKKLKKKHPYILAFTTFSADNASVMYDVYKEVAKLGVDFVSTFYSWFTTDEIGEKHTKLMQDEMGITPYCWKGFRISFDKIDVSEVIETKRRIENEKWPFFYMFTPNLKDEQIEEYYKNPANTFHYEKCTMPWFETVILGNGDVVTCRDYSDVVAGNIKEQKLSEIWNNDIYRKFRLLLKEKGGLLPVCARCCGLLGE